MKCDDYFLRDEDLERCRWGRWGDSQFGGSFGSRENYIIYIARDFNYG